LTFFKSKSEYFLLEYFYFIDEKISANDVHKINDAK
jgi:hypothetical protein